MLSIAICDDEPKVAEYVRQSIITIMARQNEDARVSLFVQGEGIKAALNADTAFDMVFLDLEMPGSSGLEIGQQLHYMHPDTLIIIVSNRTDYAFETFKMQPFRFVRKQHYQQEIEEAILAALAEYRQLNKPIKLLSGQSSYYLYPARILWVESHDKQIDIVYTQRVQTIRYRISQLEKELECSGFIRVHKSLLVNSHHILSLQKGELEMDNGQRFMVSRQRLSAIKRLLQETIW